MLDVLNTILNDMPGDPGWHMPLPRSGGTSWMYPIMIMLGFAVAIALSCIKMWKQYKIKIEPFYWFILIGVPLAILGANFGSCVLHSFWEMAGGHGQSPGKPWSDFFKPGGLAIEWGIIFVVIAASIYFPLVLKKEKYTVRDEFGPLPSVRRVSMWLYFDAVLPCVLLAQFLGRWGNYFNQEVYGAKVTSEGLAWFLYKVLPGMYIGGEWKQPLFFWEGIGNFVMFFALYFGFENIKQRKAGDLAGGYLIWYGSFRACLEPLRDSSFKSASSIVLSIIFAVVGLLLILYNHIFSARCRNLKGTKLFFSPFNLSFVGSFFKPKSTKYKQMITDLNQLLSELKIEDPEYNIKSLKIKEKISIYQEKWIKLNQKDLITQQKILETCEEKLSQSREMLRSCELGDSKLNPLKVQASVDAWENRVRECHTTIENIKNGISSWSFTKDFIRQENGMIYYYRY